MEGVELWRQTLEDNGKIQQRGHAIIEILKGESSYIRDLRILSEDFVQRLISLAKNGVLSQLPLDPLNQLLSYVEELTSLHNDQFIQLEKELLEKKLNICIGKEFLKRIDKYNELYKQYSELYINLSEYFDKVPSTDSDISSVLLQLQSSHNAKGLSLQSYMITPVKRPLRLKLAIKSLIKTTESEVNSSELYSEEISDLHLVHNSLTDLVKMVDDSLVRSHYLRHPKINNENDNEHTSHWLTSNRSSISLVLVGFGLILAYGYSRYARN
eukprot:TRINITY_DN5163_c0_g1_i1.p1 TRINITY_DN5163_c0_g1~~TRINITY_DN5163_c0_g1_i1.p1  ORF type:complete len:270 (+),score=35.51 TRINITY_DN5163_c0_g1_i1:34-843(+)